MSGSTPIDWQTVELDQILESAVDGPFGSSLKTEHYVDEPGVRVIRLQNIGDGRFLDDDRVFVAESHAAGLRRHEVLPGDLLVASLGDETHPVARSCLYPDDGGKAIVKADCFRLRFIAAKADAAFVRHVLNSPSLRIQLGGLAQGVTRDRVNLASLRRFLLTLPTVEEQRQIAEVLDGVDEAIRSTERFVAKLEQARQALLRSLLTRGIEDNGRVRENLDGSTSFVRSPLGLIPYGWSVERLGSVAKVTSGVTPSRSVAGFWNREDMPWVKTSEVNFSKIYGTQEKVSLLALSATNLRVNPVGTVLVAMYGQGATRGRCGILAIEATTNQACAAVLGTPGKIDQDFLYHYMVANYERLRSLGHGSQQTNLSSALLEQMYILVPPIREQRRITATLKILDSRRDREEGSLRKLRLLKQGLMDDLLTGRVRVADVDAAAGV